MSEAICMERMEENNTKPAQEKRCYTVEELQTILGISRGSVYELIKRKEFKWIQIGGGRYRISKKSFDSWLDEQF